MCVRGCGYVLTQPCTMWCMQRISKSTQQKLVRVLVLVSALMLVFFGVEDIPRTSEQSVEQPVQVIPPIPEGLFFVERVVDGDTIVVRASDGTQSRVRLIGIDTPESVHPTKPVECFGKEASIKLRELIEGKIIRMEYDASQGMLDTYDRVLGYVFLEDGTFVNEIMVAHGYAYEYAYNKVQPYQYQDMFVHAQETAQATKQGLWADGACEDVRE